MKTLNSNYLIHGLMGFVLLFIMNTECYSQNEDSKTDRELVHAAIEDYVLGLYDVAPERIARSVDTALHKVGYYDHKGKAYDNVPMTYQQLYDLAAKWNKSGKEANEESLKIIDIYEVHDKTASAKLSAVWGVDFMHLSKIEGQWKIKNIMWQFPPQ